MRFILDRNSLQPQLPNQGIEGRRLLIKSNVPSKFMYVCVYSLDSIEWPNSS